MSEFTNTLKTAGIFNKQALISWLIWGLSCLFYFYEFLLQVSPGVMSNELMRDFQITSQSLGILVGIYFYSYSAMQLPCGVLMDYYGPHRILTLATTICAVSTIAFGMTNSFYMACAARLMIGFGSAFAVVGALKLAANWFPAPRFALLTGLMVTVGMLGAIGGEAPLAYLIAHFGWRHSMLIMGVVGLILAFFILIFVKDTPPNYIAHPAHHKGEVGVVRSLIAIVKNKQLWLVALYGGLMYMSTPVLCGLWGVSFLMVKMSITKTVAAYYISLILIGWAVASPLWGLYSSQIGRRKPPLYIGSVGALISSLLFIYAPIERSWIMGLTLFAFGIFSSGFLPSFAIAKELCNRRYVATSLSFMNMMNMVGVALMQPTIGVLLDQMWNGTLADNVRHYPIHAYQVSLSLLPIGILISLLILPFLKETYCNNVYDKKEMS